MAQALGLRTPSRLLWRINLAGTVVKAAIAFAFDKPLATERRRFSKKLLESSRPSMVKAKEILVAATLAGFVGARFQSRI